MTASLLHLTHVDRVEAQDGPTSDIPQDLADIEDELEGTRDELSEAEESLGDARSRVAAAEAELAAIETRLGRAAGELGRLQALARDARAEADATRAVAEEAAARAASATAEAEAAAQEVLAAEQEIAEATEHLTLMLAEERTAVTRLQGRAIGAFKYGAGQEQLGLVTGVILAEDWHGILLTMSILGRLLDDDRGVVDAAEQARAAADAARVRTESAEARARQALTAATGTLAAAEAAETEAASVAAVAAEELAQAALAEGAQAAALANVRAEQARRQALYDELQADAAATEFLQASLSERITALQSAALSARRPPSPPPPAAETAGWSARLPAHGSPWAEPIATAAAANGIDPPLLAALVWAESSFNPEAVSWVGAIGLAQLMPGTAASLGVDPWVPEENLDGGARYLATQLDAFGSLELALAAYNAGPTAVRTHGGIPPFPETMNYVPTVMECYSDLLGTGARCRYR